MIVKSSTDAGATRRRAASDGTHFYHTSFIGQNRIAREAAGLSGEPELAPGALYPMAFLIEQDPGTVVRAHFHQADQWQVIIGGGGHMASHAVAPVTVHYTNAHSAYGPIKAGPEGVAYFTLRNGWDPGARYMPESRERLRAATGRVHREATGEPTPRAAGEALRGLAAPASAIILAPSADGVGAWRYRVPPGGRVTGPDPASGAGQYWVVTAGSLARPDGAALPAGSLVFVDPGDAAFAAAAGDGGVEVFALQFPRR
jgi:hypothetical protein